MQKEGWQKQKMVVEMEKHVVVVCEKKTHAKYEKKYK